MPQVVHLGSESWFFSRRETIDSKLKSDHASSQIRLNPTRSARQFDAPRLVFRGPLAVPARRT